jgi:hypothetical protein
MLGFQMALSERTRSLLCAAFAILPIMQRFSLHGLVGLLLLAVGAWQKLEWLKLIGIILLASIIWVYIVL